MSFTLEQLHTLCAIAEAAGREIMDVYDHGGVTWHKDDASPLTEADVRADAVIRAGLEVVFPGAFIWSEESRSAEAATGNGFFLVDPLDGTKEFLKRNGEFTVNIAWVQDGYPVAAVVLAPALGELFYALQGVGAWQRHLAAAPEEAALAVQPAPADQPLRVMGSRSHGGEALAAWLGRLPRPHSFVAAGSSLKFCRIAQGQADIYPRFGPTSQWDTAAAQCVLEAAGGAVLDLQGQRLRYGLERPVLNPEFVATADPALVVQYFQF